MQKIGKRVEPYLYLIPAFIFIIVFIYYPFGKNIWLSLNTVNKFREIKQFAGLSNYAKVLQDPKFIEAIRNTFVYVLVTVPVSLVIAYILASLARKKRTCSLAYECLQFRWLSQTQL